MSKSEQIILQASCVAIGERALAIEGSPGSGKSSLALALIDRGAMLIGDDGVTLSRKGTQLIASPPPNITSLLEIRGIGLVELPLASPCPLALILTLGAVSDRLPEGAPTRSILGCTIPTLPFEPGSIAPAIRAEWALNRFGAVSV